MFVKLNLFQLRIISVTSINKHDVMLKQVQFDMRKCGLLTVNLHFEFSIKLCVQNPREESESTSLH